MSVIVIIYVCLSYLIRCVSYGRILFEIPCFGNDFTALKMKERCGKGFTGTWMAGRMNGRFIMQLASPKYSEGIS
jgi:hypothetical protein